MTVTFAFYFLRYERLLKKAKSEDLTDIAALHCLYRAGVDRIGRPVLIFVGKNFPAVSADPQKVLYISHGRLLQSI